jgi:hypothetical protein
MCLTCNVFLHLTTHIHFYMSCLTSKALLAVPGSKQAVCHKLHELTTMRLILTVVIPVLHRCRVVLMHQAGRPRWAAARSR